MIDLGSGESSRYEGPPPGTKKMVHDTEKFVWIFQVLHQKTADPSICRLLWHLHQIQGIPRLVSGTSACPCRLGKGSCDLDGGGTDVISPETSLRELI